MIQRLFVYGTLAPGHLEEHWARLDEFEGIGYARARVLATTVDGILDAYVYVAAAEAVTPEPDAPPTDAGRPRPQG